MDLLLLGLDSFIVCLAVGALIEGSSRLRYAAAFGVADGLAFLAGAGLGWRLFSDGTSGVLVVGMLAAMSIYLLVVAAGAKQIARAPLWLLPGALVLDNLTYGIVGDHAAGSVFAQAGAQALSSSLMALAGLAVATALVRPVMQRHAVAPNRFAGVALLCAAGGLVLVGG